jgi:ABC-2 type transport system ATP-binding protein
VLFDLSFELKPQTITALIGPNAAGKSTLMRCIAGLDRPQQGQIRLEGRSIFSNLADYYRQIGYLPDIFGLSEQLSVIQSWTYAAKSRALPDELLEQRLQHIAKLLQLDEQLYAPIKHLSRGQKQRVGIGQVIIHQPKLLILDEPASGLDPEARYALSCLFKQLQAEGMTLLISSHILSELDEYCSHMLVIHQGHITQHKPLQLEDVYSTQIGADTAQIALLLRFIQLSAEDRLILQQAPHISHLSFSAQQVTVSIAAHAQCRAELIAYLVKQQLPLIGVELLKESLLQHYRDGLVQVAVHA